ncbi:retinoblastoma-binding protein [Grosmannia clavigera kw1407]|uniref:Retinoblastoma-binding protein n=1 Tax=Grosmannia clavigera (strain kw1407 / UAMH 11150) TaxID=655863 RepID=F0XE92_GROCL|nr:retinoblastoma-binding protein [Grosmannia clavigera kw1407]EFX03721.1 retinoblastoma-binding protein [Grosmannia clavigera kw1407]
MSSSVYFKFKSQKEPTRVEFDGTGISVFELKRDIILKSGLGDGTDFDLAIYTEDGKEEYDDDTTIIPRSTTVIARRLPPMKPGAGRAARYVSGKMPVNAKNASRREQTAKATAKATSNAIEQMNNAMTEDEKLAAMFAAQSEQWNAQQEEMSHQTPIFKPGTRRPANVPDHDPPQGYICYRCGEKGHWIQLCPTNDNPEYDNRPRVKRTTGIPRSFLKTVDKAAVLAQAADEDTKAPSGIMVNADGDFVIAEPDKASWDKFQAQTKSAAAAQEVAARADKALQELGLECPIDNKLFLEPMKTPCCGKTFCNDCITNALFESDFVCPSCQTEGVLIDDLKPDDEVEGKIQTYQKEKEASQKKTEEEGEDGIEEAARRSPSTAAASPADAKPAADGDDQGKKSPLAGATVAVSTTSATSAPSPTASQQSGSDSGAASTGGQSNPKKRPAEDEAENPAIPKAPKAMQQQQQAQQQALQQQMAGNGMGGFSMNGMGGMGGLNGMTGMNGMGGMNAMAGMGMGMMPFGGMPMNYGMGNMANMANMGGMGMGMGNMNMMNPMMNGMGMNANGGGYGAEDDAYFRKPINPHRHFNKPKRIRPSDYREL